MEVNFKEILLDYEKLVQTSVKIPLHTKDIISFEFKPSNLPHLLGLNYLVDIPILFEYQNKRISAMEIYRMIKNDEINTEEFKNSKYYDNIYSNKLCHFSSERIMNLFKNISILKFNPKKIRDFDTKLDKVDYLLYEIIKCIGNNKYDHFGIGFSNDKSDNYPNTFFVRDNKDYINEQEHVYPTSLYIKDRKKKIFFKIYWENIRKSLKKSSHYKALVKLQDRYEFNVDTLKKDDLKIFNDIEDIDDKEKLERHFKLLRLDEVTEVYKPYLDTKCWNNKLKQYLVDLIDKNNKDYLPSEINTLIDKYNP